MNYISVSTFIYLIALFLFTDSLQASEHGHRHGHRVHHHHGGEHPHPHPHPHGGFHPHGGLHPRPHPHPHAGPHHWEEKIPAGHRGVARFREDNKAAIEAKKIASGTRLDAIACLAVLEDQLKSGTINNTQFARLVLGMMLGNGFQNGVTASVHANASEMGIIERAVRRAASHVKPFAVTADQVWQSEPSPAVEQHIKTLNLWTAEVAREGPLLDYQPKLAEVYSTEAKDRCERGKRWMGKKGGCH